MGHNCSVLQRLIFSERKMTKKLPETYFEILYKIEKKGVLFEIFTKFIDLQFWLNEDYLKERTN